MKDQQVQTLFVVVVLLSIKSFVNHVVSFQQQEQHHKHQHQHYFHSNTRLTLTLTAVQNHESFPLLISSMTSLHNIVRRPAPRRLRLLRRRRYEHQQYDTSNRCQLDSTFQSLSLSSSSINIDSDYYDNDFSSSSVLPSNYNYNYNYNSYTNNVIIPINFGRDDNILANQQEQKHQDYDIDDNTNENSNKNNNNVYILHHDRYKSSPVYRDRDRDRDSGVDNRYNNPFSSSSSSSSATSSRSRDNLYNNFNNDIDRIPMYRYPNDVDVNNNPYYYYDYGYDDTDRRRYDDTMYQNNKNKNNNNRDTSWIDDRVTTDRRMPYNNRNNFNYNYNSNRDNTRRPRLTPYTTDNRNNNNNNNNNEFYRTYSENEQLLHHMEEKVRHLIDLTQLQQQRQILLSSSAQPSTTTTTTTTNDIDRNIDTRWSHRQYNNNRNNDYIGHNIDYDHSDTTQRRGDFTSPFGTTGSYSSSPGSKLSSTSSSSSSSSISSGSSASSSSSSRQQWQDQIRRINHDDQSIDYYTRPYYDDDYADNRYSKPRRTIIDNNGLYGTRYNSYNYDYAKNNDYVTNRYDTSNNNYNTGNKPSGTNSYNNKNYYLNYLPGTSSSTTTEYSNLFPNSNNNINNYDNYHTTRYSNYDTDNERRGRGIAGTALNDVSTILQQIRNEKEDLLYNMKTSQYDDLLSSLNDIQYQKAALLRNNNNNNNNNNMYQDRMNNRYMNNNRAQSNGYGYYNSDRSINTRDIDPYYYQTTSPPITSVPYDAEEYSILNDIEKQKDDVRDMMKQLILQQQSLVRQASSSSSSSTNYYYNNNRYQFDPENFATTSGDELEEQYLLLQEIQRQKDNVRVMMKELQTVPTTIKYGINRMNNEYVPTSIANTDRTEYATITSKTTRSANVPNDEYYNYYNDNDDGINSTTEVVTAAASAVLIGNESPASIPLGTIFESASAASPISENGVRSIHPKKQSYKKVSKTASVFPNQPREISSVESVARSGQQQQQQMQQNDDGTGQHWTEAFKVHDPSGEGQQQQQQQQQQQPPPPQQQQNRYDTAPTASTNNPPHTKKWKTTRVSYATTSDATNIPTYDTETEGYSTGDNEYTFAASTYASPLNNPQVGVGGSIQSPGRSMDKSASTNNDSDRMAQFDSFASTSRSNYVSRTKDAYAASKSGINDDFFNARQRIIDQENNDIENGIISKTVVPTNNHNMNNNSKQVQKQQEKMTPPTSVVVSYGTTTNIVAPEQSEQQHQQQQQQQSSTNAVHQNETEEKLIPLLETSTGTESGQGKENLIRTMNSVFSSASKVQEEHKQQQEQPPQSISTEASSSAKEILDSIIGSQTSFPMDDDIIPNNKNIQP